MKKIISLSTIPPRFSLIQPVLESLLKQTAAIDEIRLHIPRHYRRFPEYDGYLPAFPDGVTVIRPDLDMGPASKVLHCVRDHETADMQILFCDDDCILDRKWASLLLGAQAKRPDDCIALLGAHLESYGHENHEAPEPRALIDLKRRGADYRARRLLKRLQAPFSAGPAMKPFYRPTSRSGYVDMFWGVGGVVIRPRFFDERAFDIPDILWAVDDIWLSGMLKTKNISIWVPKNLPRPQKTEIAFKSSLVHTTVEGHDRRSADDLCIRHFQTTYGIWV